MRYVLTSVFILFMNILSAQISFSSSNNPENDSSLRMIESPEMGSKRFVQSTSRYLHLSYEGGYILPFDDKKEVNQMFKESNYRAITINSSWDVPASSVYSKIYRNPKLGIGVSFVTFQHEALGKPVAIFGYTEIPITDRNSKWYVSYGVGFGLGMGFNAFHKTTNPGNVAIGSSLNAYLQGSFQAGYRVGQDFLVAVGTGYRHYSNGSTKRPNAGINIFPFQVSLRYQTRKIVFPNHTTPLPPLKKSFTYNLYNSVGLKQLEVKGPIIFKNITGFNAGYQFSYKYRVALGFDLNYTSGKTDSLKIEGSSFSNHFSYGPYLGWEWYFTDRLYIPIYLGIYLHRNPEHDETNKSFQRVGIRYLFLNNKQLSAGVGLKTHFGQADFVEFGLGWHFRVCKR